MSNLRRVPRLLLAVVLLGLGLVRLAPRAEPAAAAVGHGQGFHATVDGFSSWYGSYLLGDLGVAWCIDHGIRAPDPDLAYRPTGLDSVPEATRVALAWALGRHGTGPDTVTAAALMLVAHDLMGATYPSGRLDVDVLDPGALVGFGGAAADVVGRARAIKADALAHAGLRPPWRIEMIATRPLPASDGEAIVRVTAGGAPVAGVDVTFGATGVAVLGPATQPTGADGMATFHHGPAATPYRLTATATVPDLVVQAFAPTTAPAQRVARPVTIPLATALDQPTPRLPPIPTTTTSTTTSTSTTTTTRPPVTTTTSTTRPPATTTTSTSTTTTGPPATTTTSTTTTPTTTTSTTTTSTTTATTTTATTTTSTTTTQPSTTTTTARPPSPPPTLARTGIDPWSLGATGSGLILLGSALRARPRRNRAHPV